MKELTRLIKEDMKPALGVTEPGAIAFAVATARKYVEGSVQKVRVSLNSGMYKNAFTCGIPNSNHFGNVYAAALGAVAADADLGLESLEHITPEDDRCAAQMVEQGKVEVHMDHIGSEIMIDATVISDGHFCTVRIRESHTNIAEIEKDGELLYSKKSEKEVEFNPQAKMQEGTAEPSGHEDTIPLIHRYTLHDILNYVDTVPVEEIAFIKEAFSVNLALLEEGVQSTRGVIARQLLRENGGTYYSNDVKSTAQLLCNGAIEARVLGLSRPAMSITGSGAHGIIATMPLYACYKSMDTAVDEKEAEDSDKAAQEQLLRATALSYLITMYIKEYSGRLSAFCGCGIAAGTGMACGLGYLRGAGEAQIDSIIRNMASGVTGMICDGGNHGCAMKGIVAVDAAFRSVDLALCGVDIERIHGINGNTPEDTMRYMGMIASPGMVQTEKTIVDIMESKR